METYQKQRGWRIYLDVLFIDCLKKTGLLCNANLNVPLGLRLWMTVICSRIVYTSVRRVSFVAHCVGGLKKDVNGLIL